MHFFVTYQNVFLVIVFFEMMVEIYLMKKDGTVVLYDATHKTETVKISSPSLAGDNSDYQLFVNGKEQICVMQSAPEAPSGRHIDVYSYSGSWLYKINLDLFQYGLSRDESVCIYTNAAFLAAADSKRFVLFNVKNGKFLGVILIPNHLERSKGEGNITRPKGQQIRLLKCDIYLPHLMNYFRF